MSEVNQQTIADHLSISRATVSRCFTNHPGINPSTRAKVFHLAARLGYKHMEMRTGLTEGPERRLRVGVLICTDAEEFNRVRHDTPGQAMLEGASEFGLLQDLTIEVNYVDPRAETLDHPCYARIVALHKRVWDGILLIYPFPETATDELLLRYPVVSLIDQYGQRELNSVDVDHHKGIAALINHLAELGHRRIGFFSRRYPVEAGWSYRRFSAYVEKITRMGWRYREEDTVNVHPHAPLTLEESYDYVRARTDDGVTAWLCAADHQAYDLMAGLERRGLSVPDDVSITGFDGVCPPEDRPRLTTIEIPYREIGLNGAKRLADLVRKRFTQPQHILVSSHFREGRTTAPPAARFAMG